jgi:4-hydroxy-tetrahydrodipicolinate reductase
MRILLVGYGKMGRLVASLAPEYGGEVAGVIDPLAPEGSDGPEAERWRGIDVAIDFSSPAAVASNAPVLARRGINLVIGTTGWEKDEPAVRQAVAAAGAGIVAAPNFSTGVVIFEAMVEHAATLFARQADFGAWVHEGHHAAKKDAPSGTALLLKSAMTSARFPRPIDISSTRAGSIPGTHTVGFDGPADSVTLTHTVRDRGVFAHGALEAARWLQGRRGWFSMQDVLAKS